MGFKEIEVCKDVTHKHIAQISLHHITQSDGRSILEHFQMTYLVDFISVYDQGAGTKVDLLAIGGKTFTYIR